MRTWRLSVSSRDAASVRLVSSMSFFEVRHSVFNKTRNPIIPSSTIENPVINDIATHPSMSQNGSSTHASLPVIGSRLLRSIGSGRKKIMLEIEPTLTFYNPFHPFIRLDTDLTDIAQTDCRE